MKYSDIIINTIREGAADRIAKPDRGAKGEVNDED